MKTRERNPKVALPLRRIGIFEVHDSGLSWAGVVPAFAGLGRSGFYAVGRGTPALLMVNASGSA